MPCNLGSNLARQRETFIAGNGTDVTLPDGTTRKALIEHESTEFLRQLPTEDGTSDKTPVVFKLGGSAWGVVTEGMRLVVGSGAMARPFRVAKPLHPKWRQGVVTELAVVAYPL